MRITFNVDKDKKNIICTIEYEKSDEALKERLLVDLPTLSSDPFQQGLSHYFQNDYVQHKLKMVPPKTILTLTSPEAAILVGNYINTIITDPQSEPKNKLQKALIEINSFNQKKDKTKNSAEQAVTVLNTLFSNLKQSKETLYQSFPHPVHSRPPTPPKPVVEEAKTVDFNFHWLTKPQDEPTKKQITWVADLTTQQLETFGQVINEMKKNKKDVPYSSKPRTDDRESHYGHLVSFPEYNAKRMIEFESNFQEQYRLLLQQQSTHSASPRPTKR